jgi:hypothetical protein
MGNLGAITGDMGLRLGFYAIFNGWAVLGGCGLSHNKVLLIAAILRLTKLWLFR